MVATVDIQIIGLIGPINIFILYVCPATECITDILPACCPRRCPNTKTQTSVRIPESVTKNISVSWKAARQTG